MVRFKDRRDAGRQLAEKLRGYAGRDDVLVLALPRGGVPVAAEVARALEAPLDVFLVRKLGVPGHEELAMGAVASGGTRVLNPQLMDALDIPDEVMEAIDARERRELDRRQRAYRGERPPPDVEGRTVILVDDGLATGSTMHAAVQAVRRDRPARVVVAVPVADPTVCEAMRATSSPWAPGTRTSRSSTTRRCARCSSAPAGSSARTACRCASSRAPTTTTPR
jgi:predicted phosphoribosyltransferase